MLESATAVSTSSRQPLQTVVKALATLGLFTVEREWLGVREIGRMLDLNSATVHNLLRTLAGTKLAQLDVVTAASGPMKACISHAPGPGPNRSWSAMRGAFAIAIAEYGS